MPTFLGFALAGYRSFGGDPQYIGPLGKLNILAGPNNSGKSNILNFVTRHLSDLIGKLNQRQTFSLGGMDLPVGAAQRRFQYATPIRTDNLDALASRMWQRPQEGIPHGFKEMLSTILNAPPLRPEKGVSWLPVLPIAPGPQSTALAIPEDVIKAFAICNNFGECAFGIKKSEWQRFWTSVTGKGNGDLTAHWVPEVLTQIFKPELDCPSIQSVPALRSIDNSDSPSEDLSGRGLIVKLSKLERPTIAHLKDKDRFSSIVEFLRTVVQSADADLEVPHDRQTLHVHLRGRVLPLANLGTGIHQVVMLAAAATLFEEALVCLEEPEMNLHPLLQRQLIRYLMTKTSNQYLISTHSAHFLDSEDATVFRLELDEQGWTQVCQSKTADEHFMTCTLLGYRASDLLQTNAVVWVEGPSDRIYLLCWLKQAAPELVEGLQFTVMFYGGRLLSHLTTDEQFSAELISLRKLNRNIAVLMDSDRDAPDMIVGNSKARIVEELSDNRGVAWLTDVRTIENYIPKQVFLDAVRQVHPRSDPQWDGDQYSDPFTGIASPDKVAIAQTVASTSDIDWDRYDLSSKLALLVALIKNANPPIVTAQSTLDGH